MPKNKNQIKRIIFENIHSMLPTFIDYLFSSDYTVWIQTADNGEFIYDIFDKNSISDITFLSQDFTFTRDLSNWEESTTLKYKGRSLAEIQIHKNRTFKFRFIMNALAELIVEQKTTSETLGITAEKVVCDLSGIPTPKEYRDRFSPALAFEIRPAIKKAFTLLPKAIKSTGTERGARGENSKCPYDYVLEGNKTLSLKTNTGRMVCPPEVGQPGAVTCYNYFKDYIEGSEVTTDSFKKMVLNHIADIMPIYTAHLFDSDYLLWIYRKLEKYFYKIYDSSFAKNIVWNADCFEFTKPSLETWNESNTVKYKGVSIGEFQVHKNRSCFKFRFNMENFEYLIRNHFFEE